MAKNHPWRDEHDGWPRCMRYEPHYRPGNDQRVSSALGYALGMIAREGGEATAARCRDALAYVHDHKGDLHVVRKDGAGWDPLWEVPFRQAWEFHNEVAENVFFHSEDSDAWRGIWSSRRFESEAP